jgi:hypothetical protein
MGCFESYMEFREEVEKIKIKEKGRLDLAESPGEDSSMDPPHTVAKSS